MAEFRLDTARLTLREWRDADIAPFWAMSQDAEVMRYFPPTDHAVVVDLVERQRAAQAAHGHCFWAATRCDTGGFVGLIGLGPPRWGFAEVEIGWRLARAAWGQGLATEGASAARDWAFATLGAASIVAVTQPGNAASRRVMDRIGMAHCPAEDFDHPSLGATDPLRRLVLYRAHRESARHAA